MNKIWIMGTFEGLKKSRKGTIILKLLELKAVAHGYLYIFDNNE